MSLAMTKQEREAFLADVHVGVISIEEAGRGPLTVPIWYDYQPGGELWLEAGTPENPWYLDVGREPALSFSSPTRSGEFLARPHPGEAPRQRVRSQLREKYGLRDWWVGVLFDTSRSVAVELVPSGRAPAAAGAR